MRIWRLVVIILFLPLGAFSQVASCEFPKLIPFCIFPQPFKVSRVAGRVTDEEQVSMPDTCVSVFDIAHKPVSHVRTNQDGKFAFPQLLNGKYILVTNYVGFTPALAELVVGRLGSRRMLHIHMVLSGIDTCSNVDLKK